jgi:allophanate hydrolase
MTRKLNLPSLRDAYQRRTTTPEQVLDDILSRIAEVGERPVWITVAPRERIAARLAEIDRRKRAGEHQFLYGIPFAVKDNIDVAGLPTTAGCPAFAYVPERSARVVERLEDAGAILVGKTNMDQFATGLVGTRSPYGICASVFDPAYISGGSSAGSAVAVASGLVSFALGTDTAGSGRVPAAFNAIVGLKPTKGLISTRGVVPACRSQDCVSIFAGNVTDASLVRICAAGFDGEDAQSRRAPQVKSWTTRIPQRVGVPSDPLEFFGDDAAADLFAGTVARLDGSWAKAVPIDFTPFREAAKLLYEGPWVAERLAALNAYGFADYDAMDPTVRGIILGGAALSAADAFAAFDRLAELTRAAEAEWQKMDMLLLPTTGTTYRIDAVLADPVRLNSNLGYYTNFVNLMDLSAIAIPAGFRANGLPFGITLIGRAFDEGAIEAAASMLEREDRPAPASPPPVFPAPGSAVPGSADGILLAVVGAHLTGQPLNKQLTERDGRLVRAHRTAPGYSLYALDTKPAKPGLVYDGVGQGLIELEIWELDAAGFGSFVAEIPAPLGIGTVRLEDGSAVKGFLCESHAVTGARDITAFGGWRAWLAER